MFPVYKLSRENTQPENMCDIVFEKVQGRAGKVNRASVSTEVAIRRVLLKRFYDKFPRIHTKKYLRRNLFFDKVKL